MGCSSSTQVVETIQDYANYNVFMTDMKKCGVLEDLNIMIFIDKTKSNEWTGTTSYGGKCLHDYRGSVNPYQNVIRCLKNLMGTDRDSFIPVYEFGSNLANKYSTHLRMLGVAKTTVDVENLYLESLKYNNMGQVEGLEGPTTLQYIIEEAIRVQRITKNYLVAVVITDGSPDEKFRLADIESLEKATDYPLSFVTYGVGDGPFEYYENLDDLPKKLNRILNEPQLQQYYARKHGTSRRLRFDSLQFVDINKYIYYQKETTEQMANELLFRSFMEVPKQYNTIKRELRYTPSFSSAPASEMVQLYASETSVINAREPTLNTPPPNMRFVNGMPMIPVLNVASISTTGV
jgi:E3 ubiquitin-protein ligase RGLG